MTVSDFVETKDIAQSDSRGRVALGAVAKDKKYSVSVNAAGDILLTPVVTIPERELWLHRNSEAQAMIDRGIADAEAGRTVTLADLIAEAQSEEG